MTVIVKLDIKGKKGVSAIYVDLVNTEKCSGKLTSTAFFTHNKCLQSTSK